MNKYEIVREDSKLIEGHLVYRIKALQDFADVKAGDLGGYIESERNLSQHGDAWLYGNANKMNMKTSEERNGIIELLGDYSLSRHI